MQAHNIIIKPVSQADAVFTPVFANQMEAIRYANALLSSALLAPPDGEVMAPPMFGTLEETE